jgi:multisubunit Na+/H+ antiporter MnhB subunit
MRRKSKSDGSMIDLWIHIAIAILTGGLAFRACLTGEGHGNFPGVAILAGVATGTIAFIFSLIAFDMLAERYRGRVQCGLIGLLIVFHLLPF